jgi:hypothetical protein
MSLQRARVDRPGRKRPVSRTAPIATSLPQLAVRCYYELFRLRTTCCVIRSPVIAATVDAPEPKE